MKKTFTKKQIPTTNGLHFYIDSKKDYRWVTNMNGKRTGASSEGFEKLAGAIKNIKSVAKTLTGTNNVLVKVAVQKFIARP